MNADAMFEAARQFGEQITAHRTAHRQAFKDDRNARRRARRAAVPKTPAKPKATMVYDDGYEAAPGCRCHIVLMPPCGWCESGGPVDDEEGA